MFLTSISFENSIAFVDKWRSSGLRQMTRIESKFREIVSLGRVFYTECSPSADPILLVKIAKN